MSKFTDDDKLVRLKSSRSSQYTGGGKDHLIAETAFGDVVKVIHDNNNRSIGDINVNIKTKDHGVLNITMGPLSPHTYTVPVPNEQVVCIKDPRFGKKWYYMGITSNAADINIIPNATSKTWKQDLSELYPGETFLPYPDQARAVDTKEGDVIIQGRFGQSLRMSSTSDKAKFPWRNSSSKNQSPITILRTGWLPIENMFYDASSLWLTADQHIPIPLRSPLHSDITDLERFDHGQCVLYSDRIVLGTRLDNIIINSKKNIYIQTEKWNYDVDKIMQFNEQLLEKLKSIIDIVHSMNFACQWQTFVIPGIGTTLQSTRISDFGQYYGQAATIQAELNQLQTTFDEFKQK